MKASATLVLVKVLLVLGDVKQQWNIPAPPPPKGSLVRPEPKECPETNCPQLYCPEPVCPTPVCPPPAPAPAHLPCPRASCPQAYCPEPVCPTPVCPPPTPAPPHPPCPKPSCPQSVCPQPVCPKLPPPPPCPSPSCPSCPDCRSANVSCPQPVCPQPVCSQPSCPSLPAPSTENCSAKGVASCTNCKWKVLTNYVHFSGFGFYKAYKTPVNWHQAKELCAGDGAHLGIINSEKEAELFKLLYQTGELGGWVFIGYHDLNQEGNHETIFGEPLSKTGYTKWDNGQPDNFFDEDCGTMTSNALLNDGKCDWKTGFICEISEEKILGQ